MNLNLTNVVAVRDGLFGLFDGRDGPLFSNEGVDDYKSRRKASEQKHCLVVHTNENSS